MSSTGNETKRLLVLGATGVLGQRIVRVSRALIPEAQVLGGWRRAQPDRDPGARRVDVHDPASLRRALDGVDVVINSVGPFEYDPAPILAACCEQDVDYVDIAETGWFIRRARDLSAGAQVRVASGCSTLPGLAVVLAQRWADRADVASLRVYLSLGSRKPVSPTLLYSLLRPLGRTSSDGGRYYDGIVNKPLREGPARYYGRYPASFEEEGVALGERVVPAPFFVGMDRGFIAWMLRAGATFLPRLSDGALMRWCKLILPLTGPVRLLGGPLGLLCLEALDGEGRIVDEVEVRAVRRGLDVPALPAVWTARRLLRQDRELPAGFLPLEALAAPAEVEGWLRDGGYEVWAPRPAPTERAQIARETVGA